MTDINFYLTSLDDDLNNIVSDDIQRYTNDYQKINIYNNKIKNPLQKVWIKSQKLKILNNIHFPNKSNKIALLPVILWENDPEIKKLYKFIEKLEKHIANIIHNVNENLILRSCIKKNDKFFPILTLQLPYVKKENSYYFPFNIYDCDNHIIELKQLEQGSFIKAYIELADVWMNDTEFGLNWKVLQMKIYPEFDFRNCLFIDEIPLINNNYESNILKNSNNLYNILPPPLSLNKKDNNTKGKSNKPFIPTKNELIQAMNNLKPIKESNDENLKQENKIEEENNETIKQENNENIKQENKTEENNENIKQENKIEEENNKNINTNKIIKKIKVKKIKKIIREKNPDEIINQINVNKKANTNINEVYNALMKEVKLRNEL